jgi:hypothetical protein
MGSRHDALREVVRGEHSEEVLREAGYSENKIRSLRLMA